jgi:hypothetical protein
MIIIIIIITIIFIITITTIALDFRTIDAVALYAINGLLLGIRTRCRRSRFIAFRQSLPPSLPPTPQASLAVLLFIAVVEDCCLPLRMSGNEMHYCMSAFCHLIKSTPINPQCFDLDVRIMCYLVH